jgi:hypothetical protein
MHTRRLTTLLLGLWLGASLFMDWMAASAFSTVDASYQSAKERQPALVADIGDQPFRDVLKYQTAELNRHYFYIWGFIQSAFGVALVVVILFATSGRKTALALAVAMAAMAIGNQFGVLPSMMEKDRALDFAPPKEMERERAVFAGSHNTFLGLEAVKMLAGFALAGVLLYRSPQESRRRRRVSEFDPIDNANDSRVNR